MDKNGPEIKIDNGELATSMIPEDFTEPQVLYEKLIKMIRQYHPSDDISMIEKAYRIAYKAHDGQLRKSGEPYIIHPVCVCIILAELELDKETIVAGMLHDVVEDTVMTSEELAAEFGDEVALLVDGVTKLTQLDYVADKVEVQAENLRKMFLAMAKGMEQLPEGGERCFACYELRQRKAAEYAKEHHFDYFTTTLSVSPHKNAAKLNEIGLRLAQEYGIPYLVSDFKKKGGYLKSIELSAEYQLYRQDYCGCVYSKAAREREKQQKISQL